MAAPTCGGGRHLWMTTSGGTSTASAGRSGRERWNRATVRCVAASTPPARRRRRSRPTSRRCRAPSRGAHFQTAGVGGGMMDPRRTGELPARPSDGGRGASSDVSELAVTRSQRTAAPQAPTTSWSTEARPDRNVLAVSACVIWSYRSSTGRVGVRNASAHPARDSATAGAGRAAGIQGDLIAGQHATAASTSSSSGFCRKV